MKQTFVVILAGGSGERFWPLSTRACPKQFISLFGGRPLLTLAVERLQGFIPPERIFVITASHLVDNTANALWSVPRTNIIGEPCKRDTAPAVAVACGLIRRLDPDGVVCILTADQLMRDVETFRQTLADAVQVASEDDVIVTIGIEPTNPATGFGYIEASDTVNSATITRFNKAARFVEKPDAYTAARYVESGRYFWNAGMFIWRCGVMQRALDEFAPDLAEVSEAVARAASCEEIDGVMQRLYPFLRAISVDYAIMERAQNIIMARGVFGWDDVGSWPAVAGHFNEDTVGNVIVGTCEAMECSDNIVISENRLTAMIGVSDLVVVQSESATLICPRERSEDVKKLVRRIAQRPDGEKYV